MSKTKYVTYAGRRIGNDEKIYQLFMDGKKELYFSKIKMVIVGRQYAIDSDSRMSRRPEWNLDRKYDDIKSSVLDE